MGQEMNLLDRLHELVGCEFLSDMKEAQWQDRLLRAITEVEKEEFSLEQWNSALFYLFHGEVQISAAEELHTYVASRCADIQK